MPKTKVEVYDKDQLIYPYIESDHVTFSNGMKVSEMLDQSISMPTVTHEDLSFKVGVGDQDVSNAIVDSSVAEMTIKGKTYQNILPEPSTHVLTNNKEMFKVNEGLDPNVEIVDGVSKSAILKGQTLVNVLSYERVGGGGIYTKTDDLITVKSNGEVVWHGVDLGLTQVKENTKYIIMWDSITFSNENFSPSASLIGIRTLSNNTQISSNWVKDKNYAIATVTNDTNIILRIHATQGVAISNTTTIKGLKVFEYQQGMENWDIPYFEGIQSVKMPVLSTTGKNLYSYGDLTISNPLTNRWYYTNGTTSSFGSSCKRTDGGNWFYLEKGVYSYQSINENTKTNIVLIGEGETQHGSGKEIPSGWYVFRFKTMDESVDYAKISQIQLEKGSTATPYEPHKSNTLSTPEDLELRGIGNVKDELNVATGELTQRIGEVALDGSDDEQWVLYPRDNYSEWTTYQWRYTLQSKGVCFAYKSEQFKSIGDKLSFGAIGTDREEDYEHYRSNGSNPSSYIYIWLSQSKASTTEELKTYLQSNPITIQYELAEPIVKTVDLLSSGNWEKVVLDGSENWLMTNNTHFYTMLSNELSPNALLPIIDNSLFTPKDNSNSTANAVWYGGNVGAKNGNIVFNVLDKTLEQFKQYLSQNPITVWYPTQSHKDSTQVKQPIFFKDGHIQLSSETDNSLIPTLDYQAKTSNSYVMDLMKPSTKYTMKAKSASGTFTIDGTSYGAGTNGTFTTPSSITNKLLVMSNKTNEEVMILEGDVTSKTIQYFKGIKSAFEGEDKIEVLSTGKNLFDVNLIYGAHTYGNIGQKPTHGTGYARITNETGDYILVKPNTKYTFSIGNNFSFAVAQLDKDGINLGDTGWLNNKSSWTITTQSTARYVGFNIRKLDDSDITADEVYKAYPMFEESLSATTYEPHKSNSTKIPLLSPLRSLPNGVCDELIVDRMKNKATLIQRVGYVILGQGDDWGAYDNLEDTMKAGRNILPHVKSRGEGVSSLIPYTFNSVSQPNEGVYIYRHASSSEVRVRLKLKRTGRHDAVGIQNWLRNNNIVTLYELETPIVTEVDLEGFPYIYKDGYIFLNSEIAPTTEIIYSINQCQQISASNEDIIRHEKELTYLQKLIAQYVQVDYESVLLSLKV